MLFRKCFGTDGDDDDDNSVQRSLTNNKKTVKIAEYQNRELSGLNTDTDEDKALIESSSGDNEDGSSRNNKTKLSTDPFQNIKENALLEIVGASGLACIQNDIDTFCVVKVDTNPERVVVHKTKVIPNDPNPIWTVKTDSLCLLNLSPTQKVTIELYYYQKDSGGVGGVVASIVSSQTKLCGSITVSCRELLEGDGERKEFCPSPQHYPEVSLEIRSRRAQRQDFLFFHEKKNGIWSPKNNSPSAGSSPVNHGQRPGLTPSSATDTDFQMVSTKNVTNMLFKASKKNVTIDDVKQTAYRVWPFPDPDSPNDEYLTKQQLRDVALKPSKAWVEAGSGEYGQVYLEVLGCDNLPNMDTELVDGKTDAFVACVIEGKFVRTSVIYDSLNPRWVPWSSRAFKFNIMHPSSILFLGVFDFDEGLLEAHDPISRVVIHLDKFETGTVYTLKYPLVDSETGEEAASGGSSITVRLRIHWNDEAEVAKAQTFVQPPRFMINTKTDQGLQILQYITGRHISEVTTQSVKLYVNEIIMYWRKYCYLGDVLFSIWLWRGRTTVFGKYSIWFPIDSIMLFGGLVFALERPDFIPSIILYSIAYALLANNYYLSRQPNPWLRVRKFRTTFATKNLGMNASSNIHIEPEAGAEEAKTLRLLDEYRMNRTTGFLYEFIMTGLNVYRVYSKTSPVDLSTEVKKGVGVGTFFASFYSNYLGYLHLMFRSK